MYDRPYPVTYYFYPLLEHAQNSPQGDEFRGLLHRPKPATTENLIYVHIPFCHELCRFCPFHVKVHTPLEVYEQYVRALIGEIAMVSALPYVKDMQFSVLYFGGGSPSILGNHLIAQLFEALTRHFNFTADAEISFEGEPRTLSEPDKLDLLAKWGVKRISYGLQTYDREMRDLFKIAATLEDVDRVTRNARERGFPDINVDMMYDLPGQTPEQLAYDLKMLAAHDFDSVDYYNLHYYAFPKKMKAGFAAGSLPSKPSMAMHLELAERVIGGMEQLGYHHVADQVFAKYPKVCEYFRLLWGGGYGDHRAETIGLGSSARGYLNGYTYMNHGSSNAYMKMVTDGVLPLGKVSSLLEDPRNRGAALFAKFFGIEAAHASTISTIPPAILDSWLDHGLLEKARGGLAMTPKGKLWTTNMMVDTFETHQGKLAHESTQALEERAGTRTGSF